jgi:ABC-2 type transport system ATP-binding protein
MSASRLLRGGDFVSGASTGTLSAADRAWFASRGPGALVDRIRVPTLLIQGTADTLFTLDEAVTNYRILRGNGVPAKMMWFCGGHGACLTGSGEAGHVERAVVAWMKRHLAGDKAVGTGPRFEWLADDARWRSRAGYPLPAGKPIVADGSGTLAVNPGDAASGTPISAGPAVNALNVAIPAPGAATQAVGAPMLRLAYQGTGTATHAFAQVLDTTRGVVVGDQVTPIPVELDGKPHTVTRPLEAIAASLTPQSKLRLQIIGGSQVYGPVRGVAALQVSKAHLEIPTAGAPNAGTAPVLPGTRSCSSRRRFVLHLRGRLKKKGTRVYVAGQRVKVRGRHGRLRAIIDLRGRPKQRVKVRIVAKRRSGKVVRETRRYRTCATRRR